MSLDATMSELAAAAVGQRGFDHANTPELSGNPFFGDGGTGAGATLIADFGIALGAATADQAVIGRIFAIITSVDETANASPLCVIGRLRKTVTDLTDGERAFLSSYLKATRDIDADPNETELPTFTPPRTPIVVPPVPGRGFGGGAAPVAAQPADPNPRDMPDWLPLLDQLHALFVRFEGGERKALVEIRKAVLDTVDPALKVIAEKYFWARTANPRVVGDVEFRRHFGVPVDPEPPAAPAPEPPAPTPGTTAGWRDLLDQLHALFLRYEAGEAAALHEIRKAVDDLPDGPLKAFAAEYVDERLADKRVTERAPFRKHFGVPADPLPPAPPAPVAVEAVPGWNALRAELDALFVLREAGDKGKAADIFARQRSIPQSDPLYVLSRDYVNFRMADPSRVATPPFVARFGPVPTSPSP